jgi:hypothetical protein
LKRNAGDALHDFGCVHIREGGNLLGRNDVFDVFGLFLVDHGPDLPSGFAFDFYFGQIKGVGLQFDA